MCDNETLAREVIARCQVLARFSEDVGSIRRTFLSPPMRDVHRAIAEWITPLKATSRVDAAGNLRILCPGAEANASRLLIGSHLDTVPNAGAYDGILGVVLAIALLTASNGRKYPFAIEVIGFSEEEGIRFATPFIGSRALVGSLDEELLNRQDGRGVSVRDAIANFGLNPAEIPQAAIGDDTLAYIEFHIEQGPVLENSGHALGVVDAIVGQSRMEFTFVGHANHAGTTPMHLRHDAVAAAAEWISAVEHHAQTGSGLVATVGSIQAKPGAVNVIAGEARLTLDVRHQSDEARNQALDYFVSQAADVATRRRLRLQSKKLMDQQAVPMDPFLTNQLAEAVRRAGCEPFRMVSGAGHDAMILAAKIPSAMVFLRTPAGISHDPAETVEVGDVARAIDCGIHLLDQLASSSDFLSHPSRTNRA
ncbi:MAG TPA: allantoate amidohydrolase [Terriglobales bacterium]|jgi:allantoate deiminase|nr:allantoate amidohydrolase [Terriglobales bacterium]